MKQQVRQWFLGLLTAGFLMGVPAEAEHDGPNPGETTSEAEPAAAYPTDSESAAASAAEVKPAPHTEAQVLYGVVESSLAESTNTAPSETIPTSASDSDPEAVREFQRRVLDAAKAAFDGLGKLNTDLPAFRNAMEPHAGVASKLAEILESEAHRRGGSDDGRLMKMVEELNTIATEKQRTDRENYDLAALLGGRTAADSLFPIPKQSKGLAARVSRDWEQTYNRQNLRLRQGEVSAGSRDNLTSLRNTFALESKDGDMLRVDPSLANNDGRVPLVSWDGTKARVWDGHKSEWLSEEESTKYVNGLRRAPAEVPVDPAAGRLPPMGASIPHSLTDRSQKVTGFDRAPEWLPDQKCPTGHSGECRFRRK